MSPTQKVIDCHTLCIGVVTGTFFHMLWYVSVSFVNKHIKRLYAGLRHSYCCHALLCSYHADFKEFHTVFIDFHNAVKKDNPGSAWAVETQHIKHSTSTIGLLVGSGPYIGPLKGIVAHRKK